MPDPIIEGAPGHGEGHNTGMPLNVVAAIAVKRIMERDKLPGTIMLWPGVAEELLATKAWYVRDGVFKDVDIVLFTHVGNNLGVSWGEGGGNGMVSVEYTFEGETAHSAGAPWRGRSALDAVELMNIGWNYRREHLRLSQRSHSVITNGGDQPNVVPRNASIWYYFRETDYANIKRMWDIGDKMAEGAALMTNTKWSSRILGAAYPQHMNKTVAETMWENIKTVGLPVWSEADQTLAKALQKELGNPTQPGLATNLGNIGAPNPNRGENTGGGSDDIGDVSWNYPTVTLRFPSNIPGLPGHNWSSAIASATPIAHKGVVAGAKVQAMTVLDLMTRPELVKQALGVLQQRADEGREVRPADQARHAAGDSPQQGDPREVSRADAEVLLRPDQVPDVSRSVGHQVPDGSHDDVIAAAAESTYAMRRGKRIE